MSLIFYQKIKNQGCRKNKNTFEGVKNVEKRLGNIALELTKEGQNVFAGNAVYNPHAATDNLIGRIKNGEEVTNQELMLFNQTKNKNRFKVLTGIDLSGNPGEVRSQLNTMIRDGKGSKALTDAVTRINNEKL